MNGGGSSSSSNNDVDDDDDRENESLMPTLVAATPPEMGIPVSAGSEPTRRSAVLLAGRYEIQALLGVGGMGAVYRARDLELDEHIALKMLRRELMALPEILTRFRQEVKLARKVTSPHVARTFDIGEHDGEKFLTMELVDGESLAVEMEHTGKMQVPRVIAIAMDVCSGLSAAHAATVVHRDLKPDNVLIGKNGNIKITDFGIATAQADIRLTHGISGTPAYMAPEQVTADIEIDHRADLYALGLMVYEMLTGELPWQGDSAIVIATARLLADPPNVLLLRPDVPPVLADLILRCMARNRERRPRDAGEIAATLLKLSQGLNGGDLFAIEQLPLRSPLLPSPAAPRSVNKTIAVLPLRNRGAAGDDYLADGLTDDLIDSLSMVRGLRVQSRSAVMRYKNADRNPREIGRELGVHVFVEGSLTRYGETLRVQVRLVSVEDAFQLWAQRFERPLSDVLVIGDEIALAIANATNVEAAPKPEMNRDPAALDLYLRARHAYFAHGTESTAKAVELFEQALKIAPSDPQILAGAAMAHLGHSTMHKNMGEDFERAIVVAERAVELAPELADGHIALANLRLHQGRDLDSVAEAKLAFAAAPSNAEAHFLLGRFCAESGSPREALAHLELSQTLDPRLNLAITEAARVRALLGEWGLAEAMLDQVVRNEADSPFLYWGNLLRFVMWERNPTRTARVIAMHESSSSINSINVVTAVALLKDSTSRAYEDDLDHWLSQSKSSRRKAFFYQLKAETAAFQGDVDRCLNALHAANQFGLTDFFWLEQCPLFNFVREHPQFAESRLPIKLRADAILTGLGTSRKDR